MLSFGLIELELSHIYKAVPGAVIIMKSNSPNSDISIYRKIVHLNKYETAPNLIQLSQNLTSDCLLI